ncbi:hypothetical protein SeLEV6574_g03934 [Synchytrium endobioticum]|uniref:Uncharacterized protein n=2 Tax=Synchytrium endobioticum TaxID=286115 RepID=A0A507D1X6_9FUNG|nr:hypothetical protein SeLEV6574_g03934 [Synchytrium endobioticum]
MKLVIIGLELICLQLLVAASSMEKPFPMPKSRLLFTKRAPRSKSMPSESWIEEQLAALEEPEFTAPRRSAQEQHEAIQRLTLEAYNDRPTPTRVSLEDIAQINSRFPARNMLANYAASQSSGGRSLPQSPARGAMGYSPTKVSRKLTWSRKTKGSSSFDGQTTWGNYSPIPSPSGRNTVTRSPGRVVSIHPRNDPKFSPHRNIPERRLTFTGPVSLARSPANQLSTVPKSGAPEVPRRLRDHPESSTRRHERLDDLKATGSVPAASSSLNPRSPARAVSDNTRPNLQSIDNQDTPKCWGFFCR